MAFDDFAAVALAVVAVLHESNRNHALTVSPVDVMSRADVKNGSSPPVPSLSNRYPNDPEGSP
jgi:hypothetical protein